MNTTAKRLALILLAMIAVLAGCSRQIGDYMAASSISRQGFASGTDAIRRLHGQEVKLWGYVDDSRSCRICPNWS